MFLFLCLFDLHFQQAQIFLRSNIIFYPMISWYSGFFDSVTLDCQISSEKTYLPNFLRIT